MNIKIHNHTFILHPTGAAFWVEQNKLFISDVHLGKVGHFRKFGMAIPSLASHDNFIKLSDVVDEFEPDSIVFLGDLFHSDINQEWDDFVLWKSHYNQKMILVEGNHDIIDNQNYLDIGIEVMEELKIEKFLFTHHPTESKYYFNFCGHIHPGIKLKGIGRQLMKFACFFHKPNQLIFPSFGTFTGNYYLKPTLEDKVYVLAKSEVIEIKVN